MVYFMEHPIKMDDLGVPYLWTPPYSYKCIVGFYRCPINLQHTIYYQPLNHKPSPYNLLPAMNS